MRQIFMGMIKLYQKTLSPLVGNQCRFSPTCSCYAHEAFSKHGTLKGLFLTLKRLLKCHPWVKCDWQDNVPEKFEWKNLFKLKKEKK